MAQDITGKRFGKLIALRFDHSERNNKTTRQFWLFQCDCGKLKVMRKDVVTSGHNISCGCEHEKIIKATIERKTKHGLHKTTLYKKWKSIKGRCLYNAKDKRQKNYKNRNIIMCQEWQDDFLNFYNWALANGFEEGLTIDRINNDGNYEPSNCRWVDMKHQGRNRRTNKFITFQNETHCLSEWAEKIGISRNTLLNRLKSGWNIERALTEPRNEKYVR